MADAFTQDAVATRALAAAAAGVPWIQLRDHGASADAFAAAARDLVRRLRSAASGLVVSVNGRPDLAASLGVGLHVGSRGPGLRLARRALPPGLPLGYSAHSTEEACRAVAAGANYLFFSPIFPTRSKPGHPGAGLPALGAVCAAVPKVPVFALGGITPARVAPCRAAGAHGVAVLSGILSAPDTAEAAAAFVRATLRDMDPPILPATS